MVDIGVYNFGNNIVKMNNIIIPDDGDDDDNDVARNGNIFDWHFLTAVVAYTFTTNNEWKRCFTISP